MTVALNDLELRILGVLMEKSLTQPGTYPLTINAIVAGANQKQNRVPVMTVTEAEVGRALHALTQKDLVVQAPPSPGARANRFAHNVVEALKWDRREQAIMAELILRGRQTAGELRTRAVRMVPFDDVEAVNVTLRALARRDPPFVEELPREPGRSANRFRHRLRSQAGPTGGTGVVTGTVVSAAEARAEPGPSGGSIMPLEQRVSRLEQQIAQLQARVEELAPRSGRVDESGEPRL